VTDATWAPDGSALAYLTWNAADGHGAVKVVTADGRTTVTVTDDALTSAGFFTPDGKALVFDAQDKARPDWITVRVARFGH
jgi:Tol biopolymer transport system component